MSIAYFAPAKDSNMEDVPDLVSCYPSTLQGIFLGFNADKEQVQKYVIELMQQGRIAVK